MRPNFTAIGRFGGSLLVAVSCNGARPPVVSDAAAGASGEAAGQGGNSEVEAGAPGLSQGGVGGKGETPAGAGAAGTDTGEAGAPFDPAGAGGEAVGGRASGEAGASGDGGANLGGEPGNAGAAGAAGAPPSWVTAEQRALCESICAKKPLTNGFAGAPTAPCLNNDTCVERVCGVVDPSGTITQRCAEEFTKTLLCWNAIPDEVYECAIDGLFLTDECAAEAARMAAAC